MDRNEKRQLRALGHHLKPVLTVGGAGLTPGVLAEAERALRDHELIKAKLPGGDRTARSRLADELAGTLDAEIVQTLGNTVLLYRFNPDADPRLSNRLRLSTPS